MKNVTKARRVGEFAVGLALSAAVLSAASGTANAQWSTDAAVNLTVGDRSGEQIQPKVRVLADGSCYIAWLDNAAGGYDTYVQRLDAGGTEQWAHNGVLVVNTSFSSTQDYGFTVDGDGNAVVGYRDDRSGVTQIGVNKLDASGTLLWGGGRAATSVASGVSVNSPKVAALSDGATAVGWSQGSGLGFARLDADGSAMWASNVVTTPATGSYLLADMAASDDGAFIAIWVRATGGFSSPRYLWTQKYDADGNAMWNSGNPVVLFDGSSVQNGYFPSVISDGAGGAVYGWYEIGGTRRGYVQRIDSAGVELFAHNGVACSTNSTGRIVLSPWFDYDRATGDIYMAWTEGSSPTQNQWGVYAQKFSGGVRQWGDGGREILPLSTNQNSFVRCAAAGSGGGGGVSVYWFEKPTTPRVLGSKLAGDGTDAWSPAVIEVTSNTSTKGRLDIASVPGDCTYLTWHDARADSNNIVAQAVKPDGTLGACPGPACPADYNQDGGVDGQDIEAFYVDFEDGLLGADVNQDGGVDGSDVEYFFLRWEAGGC